jgi:homoserine dehydrogenase
MFLFQVLPVMVAPLKVGIAGLGTVGAEVVRLIERQSRVLSARCGRGIRVVAVTAVSTCAALPGRRMRLIWPAIPASIASSN